VRATVALYAASLVIEPNYLTVLFEDMRKFFYLTPHAINSSRHADKADVLNSCDKICQTCHKLLISPRRRCAGNKQVQQKSGDFSC
jgi:hypothetical protein